MTRSIDDQPRTLGPIEREAHSWVRRLTSGAATQADAQALKQWRARSDAHAAAFLRAQEVWRTVGMAGRQVSNRDPLPAAPRSRRGVVDTRRRLVLGGALSAVAAASVAFVYPPLDLWPSLDDMRADYRTGAGEQRQVVLADNVKVALNTRTRIALRSVQGPDNGIELIGGEAAIEMTRSGRPFVVVAGNGRTVADIGRARFEVRHMARGICVTCLEGEVRVERDGKDSLVLHASQQAIYDASALSVATTVDPIVASAWREGVLMFRQTALREVIAELNRYRPGRIVLLNRSMAGLPVNGRFRIDNLDQAILQIRQAFHLSARPLPGDILLLS